MIPVLVVAACAVLALFYVATPLRRGAQRFHGGENPEATEAEAVKRVALLGILDLEEERDAGKLTQPDYESLRAEYEVRAVIALRQVDRARSPEPDDDLEAEIAALREEMRCSRCDAIRAPGNACERCGA
ncbi:MAG: hypothetical protein ACR2LG_12665 [Actinomycetota bacterium]|nr:hypothetical protein [Actinomycetota bacterium]